MAKPFTPEQREELEDANCGTRASGRSGHDSAVVRMKQVSVVRLSVAYA